MLFYGGLPLDKVFIVDYRITKEEYSNLKLFSDNIILCPRYEKLYDAIDGHVDIQVHIIDNNCVVVHKDMKESFIISLKNHGISVDYTEKYLEGKYPHNIHLNGLNLKRYFVHNISYTDPVLLQAVKDKILINVKQGYTKCSVAVVNDEAVITSDKKIYSKLLEKSLDVLLVPVGNIILEGLDYGFIGGTCGKIDDNTLGFYGSLDNYKYGEMVKRFLEKHNVKPYYLSSGKLIDRGSIFTLTKK